MNSNIWITTEFPGKHQWLNAPEEVSFLRNLHRHLFKVRVEVKVKHSDRDVEFFILKGDVNRLLCNTLIPHLEKTPSMSCEMMGELIITELVKQKYKVQSVEVSEDAENGAIVTP